jgi:hypothetical protein
VTNSNPSNASRGRKRESRKVLSISLPDKESVHGIKSPILSKPNPRQERYETSRQEPSQATTLRDELEKGGYLGIQRRVTGKENTRTKTLSVPEPMIANIQYALQLCFSVTYYKDYYWTTGNKV